jgi:hypothetical protein
MMEPPFVLISAFSRFRDREHGKYFPLLIMIYSFAFFVSSGAPGMR